MTTAIDGWATTAGAHKVLVEARRRIEGGSQLVRGTLRVELSPAERRQVGDLLGVAWEASDRGVPVSTLHTALEARGTSLRSLLEREGPLRDLSAEREARRSAVQTEKEVAASSLIAVGVDQAVATWVTSRRGLPRAGTGALLALADRAAIAWSRLPQPGTPPILLARYAGAVFDDPHVLDRNTDLGRTIARLAAASVAGVGGLETVDVTAVTRWRAAWATVGIICDTVSSLVLTLNLRLEGIAPAVALTAVAGEPTWLTLRALRGDWSARQGTELWVCENPSVVEAAADRIGPRCPPLLCTFGQPTSAATEVVRRVHDAGCSVYVRADDDPAGQSIVAQLLALAPRARLWRFERRSATAATATPVFEEQILEELLDDLERAAGAVAGGHRG